MWHAHVSHRLAIAVAALESGAGGMLTNSIIGMVRRRWLSERPFEGSTKESIERKIDCAAIREEIKDLARRELHHRALMNIWG